MSNKIYCDICGKELDWDKKICLTGRLGRWNIYGKKYVSKDFCSIKCFKEFVDKL